MRSHYDKYCEEGSNDELKKEIISTHDFCNYMETKFNRKVELKEINEIEKDIMREELMEIFKSFDKDDDGFIPVDEFRHLMTHFGEKLEIEEVNAMIKEVGTYTVNNIEQINYEELIYVMMMKG